MKYELYQVDMRKANTIAFMPYDEIDHKKVWFKNYDMVNSSNYLNAMIFNSNDYDSETSTMTFVGRIENFVQEKYSIIENLPRDIYCFNYYQYYKFF